MHFRLSMCAKLGKNTTSIYIYGPFGNVRIELLTIGHGLDGSTCTPIVLGNCSLCSNFVVLSAQPKYVRHGIAYCSHPRDVGVQLCILSHCYQALFEEAATWLCTWCFLGIGLPPNHTCKWLGNLVQVFLKLFLATSVSKLQFIFTAYLW